MSRVIKFKAWDKDHKTMVSWEALKDAKASLALLDGDIYIELMQFTDLLDKNGEEIYEGDIIDTPEGMAEVRYNHGSFMLKYKAIKNMRHLGNKIGRTTDEVIGNIWQNPKLLI